MHHLPEHLRRCIENCTFCHQVCLASLGHCQSQGGLHSSAEHLNLIQDCAEICQTSANFMLRQSPRHELTCSACANICEQCAAGCQSLKSGDKMMQECIQACQQCAQSCREMSQAAAG